MSPHKTKWFAVIVHYGNVRETNELVRSLFGVFDVTIVVDHGPQSQVLSFADKNTVVVRPSTNTGYGGGIEVGLGALFNFSPDASDMIIIMNNDIQLQGESVQNIKKWWSRQKAPVIAGLKMGTVNMKNGRTSISDYPLKSSPYNLTYLHGSLISGPYHIVRALHIPQHYFMYWEDVFLSAYAKKKGIKLAAIENINVQHDESTNMKSDDHTYYLVRNGALFLERETTGHWKTYWWLRNRLRLLYQLLPTGNPQRKIVKRALLDAMRKRTGQVSL